MYELHKKSSVAEVCKISTSNGQEPWRYAKDHHFEKWCFEDINTIEDVLNFCILLDSESTTYCTKARSIRNRLGVECYANNPKILLASARRVCCGCHETGSFSKVEPYATRKVL